MTKGCFIGIVALGFVLTGCGSKDEAKGPAAPPPPAMTKVGDPVAETTPAEAPALDAPVQPVTPPPTEEAPVSADQAALEALNRAFQQYQDPSSRPNAGDITESATKVYPAIKDMSDLVKAGFIKAIPAAPAGKKFAIENGQVVLVNQ